MINEFKGQIKDQALASFGCYPGIYRFYLATDEADVYRHRNGYVLCETNIPLPPDDSWIIVKGSWNGNMFEAKEMRLDTSTQSLSLTLIKGAIKNVKTKYTGIKIANTVPKKLLAAMNDDIITYLKSHQTESALVEELPKIGPETLGLIYTELKVIVGSLTVIPFLSELGISSWKATRLIELYGPQAIKKLKRRPYVIGMEAGLQFNDCDKIAFSLKKDQYSKERIAAAAVSGLQSVFNSSGSTFCDMASMYRSVQRILTGGSYPYEVMAKPFISVAIERNKKFTIFENNGELVVTLKYIRDQELSIAKNIKRLTNYVESTDYSDSFIPVIEKKLGIHYEKEQEDAIKTVKDQGLYILTGGPGTGKTTTISGIIELYKMMGKKNIVLCAPTGRAAQRIKETSGMPATTIHRLLEIKPFEIESSINKQNPIGADLIIVDEFSMVDTMICSLLLDAVKDNTTIILVGDEEQLRSVGPGNVLHDILLSGKVRSIRLKKILRQSAGGHSIIDNAHKIRTGDYDLIEDERFKIIRCKTQAEARAEAIELFLEEYDEDDPFSIQFMTPLRKSIIGVNSLNETIKEKYCPSITTGTGKFRRGDRVIFTRNNAGKNYFNGDLGIVSFCEPGRAVIKVQDNEITVQGPELEDVMLSYFITIHKSQGSEFEKCVILLPEEPKIILTRNLLNTAITRAKKELVIIEVGDSIKETLNRDPVPVNTGLGLLLGVNNAKD